MRGGALILAAGYSRRFGSDKRWHEMKNGESLLTNTLKLYLGAVNEVVVVLRKDDRQLAEHIQKTFKGPKTPDILFSPNSHLGMGHSISDAMAHLQCWDYLLLALGDMPNTLSKTISAIEHEIQKTRAIDTPKIVRPFYQGQKAGHPVGFTKELFTALEALQGDSGAKQIIKRNSRSLVQLKTNDDGVLWDLDKKPV